MDPSKNIGDIIKGLARLYQTDFCSITELEKVVKIRIWKELEENPNISHLLLPIIGENAIKSFIEKQKIKHPYNEKDNLVEESLFKDMFESSDERLDFFNNFLRKHFSKNYVKGIREKSLKLPAKIVRFFLNDVCDLSVDEIPKKADYNFFVEKGLGRFLWVFYENSPMRAIQDAHPDCFFEWEFNRVSDGFWEGKQGYENALDSIKWIVLKYEMVGDEKKVPIGYEEFKNEGLGAMLKMQFSHSPFLALKTFFPNLKEWQMKAVPKGFYKDEENHKLALDSMLFGLGFPSFSALSPEEIYDCNPRKIRKKHLEEGGLRGLLARNSNSVYETFNFVYPGKVYPWFFKSSKRHLGNVRESAAKSIKWLFDDYLKIPVDKIPLYATNNLFWKVGFSGVLTKKSLGLNSSTYSAINLAYPGRFSKEDFNQKRKTRKIILSHDFRV